VHRCDNEAGWWEKTRIDPTVAARALWLETRPGFEVAGDEVQIVGALS